MSRKFRAALAAAGAAVLMATGFTDGTASAAPADAPEAWDDCAKGHVCMWDKREFSGEKIVDWKPRHAGGAVYNLPASTAYRANSIRNNSDFHLLLGNQRDGNGIGQALVCAQTSRGDLYGFNNATKSMRTLHQCRPPVEPEGAQTKPTVFAPADPRAVEDHAVGGLESHLHREREPA